MVIVMFGYQVGDYFFFGFDQQVQFGVVLKVGEEEGIGVFCMEVDIWCL